MEEQLVSWWFGFPRKSACVFGRRWLRERQFYISSMGGKSALCLNVFFYVACFSHKSPPSLSIRRRRLFKLPKKPTEMSQGRLACDGDTFARTASATLPLFYFENNMLLRPPLHIRDRDSFPPPLPWRYWYWKAYPPLQHLSLSAP